jgi:para-nitrobenzyl esterase
MRTFVADSFDGKGTPLTAAEYPQVLRELYGSDAPAVLAEYPLDRYPTPSLALATLLTDDGRMLGACGQLPADDAIARRSAVYAYEFAQPGDDVVNGFPLGAAHGADVPYFFDGRVPGWNPPLPPDQRAFADKLIGFWTTFAHTGSPGPAGPRTAMALRFPLICTGSCRSTSGSPTAARSGPAFSRPTRTGRRTRRAH